MGDTHRPGDITRMTSASRTLTSAQIAALTAMIERYDKEKATPAGQDIATFTPDTPCKCYWCPRKADYLIAYGCASLHLENFASCANCWQAMKPKMNTYKCPRCSGKILDWAVANRNGEQATSW